MFTNNYISFFFFFNFKNLFTSYSAVGMLCLFMKSLEKALEPSILAAAADGPKHGIPTSKIKQFLK